MERPRQGQKLHEIENALQKLSTSKGLVHLVMQVGQSSCSVSGWYLPAEDDETVDCINISIGPDISGPVCYFHPEDIHCIDLDTATIWI